MKTQELSPMNGDLFNPQDAFDQCVCVRDERDSDAVMADLLDAWFKPFNGETRDSQVQAACH